LPFKPGSNGPGEKRGIRPIPRSLDVSRYPIRIGEHIIVGPDEKIAARVLERQVSGEGFAWSWLMKESDW
jgi:hypothetical protein